MFTSGQLSKFYRNRKQENMAITKIMCDQIDILVDDSRGKILCPDEDADTCIYFPDEDEGQDEQEEIIILSDEEVGACNENLDTINECCEKLCFLQLSRYDIMKAKAGYPGSTADQGNWILNYLQMFALVTNVMSDCKVMKTVVTNFLICGKVVCQTCWRKVYGISIYRWRKYLDLFLHGHTLYIHGNVDTLKMRQCTSECLGWLLNYVSTIGEHIPNENKIELPAGMTKKDVFQKMDEELGNSSIPDKSKYRIWNMYCNNVKTTKGSSFSKCHFCIKINNDMLACLTEKDHTTAEMLKKERQDHWNDIREERLEYYKRRDISRQDPSTSLCIILDAMDQCKTALPICKRRVSKEICSRVIKPIKTYLTGALIHRQGQMHNKVGHCYFDFTQYSHDTNLNISVLLEILKDYRNELGKQLNIQMDSASNNKNGLMIAFGGMLVHLKIFKEVFFHMLPVGHTHEDIDAMFHNISDSLKSDVFTFPDMVHHIIKIGFIEKVNQLSNVWDFKSWLEPHMVGCHSIQDCFHIHVHDKQGKIVWHYKKWSRDRWLPDPANNQTYLDDTDKDGIVIFKSFPTSYPNTVNQSWNSDIITQFSAVSKKLLACGLLTEKEKEWWKDPLSKVQGSNTDEIICPLKELAECGVGTVAAVPPKLPEDIVVLKEQQKRVNTAYSGKYLPPAKRERKENRQGIQEDDDEESGIRFPIVTKSGRQATKFLAI